jgi:hypothetical protein
LFGKDTLYRDADHEVHRVATAPRQYVGLVLVLLKVRTLSSRHASLVACVYQILNQVNASQVVSLRMACSPLAPSELVLYAITSLSLVDVVLLAERYGTGPLAALAPCGELHESCHEYGLV